MTVSPPLSPAQVDYDLHGIVGIRLVDAKPADVAIITEQIGSIQSPLSREPDIIIRFTDRLPTSSRVRYLGLNDAGFTDDAFLILRSKHKTHARVRIPFEQIGGRCEIVCERGLAAVPLLIAVINLTALGKGFLPLHASAITYRDKGVIATGWSKGGKTELLLAFMSNGARHVGDEWLYISPDGSQMFGIPEPMRVWDWQLDDLPKYRALLSRGKRAKLRALKLAVRVMDWLADRRISRKSALMRMVSRVAGVLKLQLNVQVPPPKLFGADACPFTGTPDILFFVASHETPDMLIEPMDSREIARRMLFSLQEEQKELLSYYWKFRFAFPDKSNGIIDNIEALQQEKLEQMLSGKKAYAFYHPYPVYIPSIFEAIDPLLS
jgi:hypothetical protein